MVDATSETIHLYSWAFLSAAARESVAGNGGDAGFCRAVSRLERAHLRGVLCDEWRGAHPERKKPYHADCEQLRAHKLQLWANPVELVAGQCTAHTPNDCGRRAAQPAELQGA